MDEQETSARMEGLTPAELIARATSEVEEVKRWIDNDVEAGDTTIQEHADRLANALRDLDAAKLAMRAEEAQTA